MSVTKPILLNETGREMVEAINGVENAIRGIERTKNPWSITINTAKSSPVLDSMGGDVTSWYQYRAKIGRYLVSNDGKAKKLCKTDSRLYEDHTEINESEGHVMVRLPRLYYKVTTEDSLLTLTMCEREFANAEEFDEQWVGAYIGAVVSNALVSRSKINPTRSRTITQFWNAAQQNGTNWGLVNYEQRKFMILLFLCEFLDLNSQECLGNGMTGTGNNWCGVVQNEKTGATAELGDECGKVMFTEDGQLVSGASHVSLFGIEDPYGWFWEMVQGCYFGNENNDAQDGTEAFIYEKNAMPTEEELATNPAQTYRQLVRPTSGGWLKSIIGGGKFDVLPATLGGSSTSYWCDYYYANKTGQLLLWGGSASNGSSCGLAFAYSYAAFSASSSSFAARLAYYGQVEIIG